MPAGLLTGAWVKARDGALLGMIDDILIDPGSSRVSYALVTFGEIPEYRDRMFAIPWSLVRKASATAMNVVLDLSISRLRRALARSSVRGPRVAYAEGSDEIVMCEECSSPESGDRDSSRSESSVRLEPRVEGLEAHP
jgi:sporulation protein YlmC with PRC-barrel domain